MTPHYLPLPDMRLVLRWIAEEATPGRIAVAVSEPQPIRRRNGRIVLLDPTDYCRHLLMEYSA